MAAQTSELYATTIFNLLEDVWDKDKGDIVLDLEDEVHRGAVVLKDGELLWPPPTRTRPRSHAPQPEAQAATPKAPIAPQPSRVGPLFLALIAILLAAAALFAPSDFTQHLTVFLLACVVGWHVIWNVSPALHTPLMSVTNAISGIILVGGVVLLRTTGLHVASILAGVAVLVAMINVSWRVSRHAAHAQNVSSRRALMLLSAQISFTSLQRCSSSRACAGSRRKRPRAAEIFLASSGWGSPLRSRVMR